MTHLWSGRFDTAPDAAAFEFGASFRFDRRLFEDDVTGSLAWGRALRKAGVLTAEEAAQHRRHAHRAPRSGRADPAFVSGDDEDVHSFVERQLVERRRRRRPPAAHRAVAQRAGVARSAALPAAPDSAAAARCVASLVERARGAGGVGGRRADAVVHPLPPGAAGARRAFLPLARGAAAPRFRAARRARATRPTRCRSAAARLPARRTPSTSTRSPRISASPASSTTAWTPRRTATSRRRSCTPAR